MIKKIFDGYSALYALATGDVDTAYNLTHTKNEKQKQNSPSTKPANNVMPDTFKCCGCNRKLNSKVKKCVCGMEYHGDAS